MKRLITTALGIVTVATIANAAAATLEGTSAGIQAGSATVGRCDTTFQIDYVVYTVPADPPTQPEDLHYVSGINIGDIAPECSGGAMTVVLVDSSGLQVAAGSHSNVTSSSLSVNVSPSPQISQVSGTRVLVIGG